MPKNLVETVIKTINEGLISNRMIQKTVDETIHLLQDLIKSGNNFDINTMITIYETYQSNLNKKLDKIIQGLAKEL